MTKPKTTSTSVLTDPSDILAALVAVKEVRILSYRRLGPVAEIALEQAFDEIRCESCDTVARVKERRWVDYIDLPAFGTPMRLRWRKHRMRCLNPDCDRRTWTVSDHRIAAKGCLLTTRCAKWATEQVGRHGRSVEGVAKELGCDWEVVNNAVMIYGPALLEADHKRLNKTTAIGLDETSVVRLTDRPQRDYATTVADVENHQIIEILPSCNYVDVAGWINKQPRAWKERIRFGALDMSNTYAAVFSVTLPKADQVVDSFHCIQLANRALDAVRRRVQNEQTGHRGRKNDPLYRARRVLLTGEDKLSEEAKERLSSLLELGDPNGEVAIAYRVKERLRDFYATDDIEAARVVLSEIVAHCLKKAMPSELQKLGRTLKRWFDKICNYHLARITNGPTEALNNLIKRIKRIAFGFRNFENYRIRALLYAGKPNWRVLGSIVVR